MKVILLVPPRNFCRMAQVRLAGPALARGCDLILADPPLAFRVERAVARRGADSMQRLPPWFESERTVRAGLMRYPASLSDEISMAKPYLITTKAHPSLGAVPNSN